MEIKIFFMIGLLILAGCNNAEEKQIICESYPICRVTGFSQGQPINFTSNITNGSCEFPGEKLYPLGGTVEPSIGDEVSAGVEMFRECYYYEDGAKVQQI